MGHVTRDSGAGFQWRSYGPLDRGGRAIIKNAGAAGTRGENATGDRGQHRVINHSMGILDRVSRALANGKNGLTRQESIEVGAALDDIAVRLEQVAEAVAQLKQLSKPEETLKHVDLTERELEILGCLADGKTNVEIAAHCWISKNTVKFHLKNLFRKLEVRERGQAVMIAKSVRHVGHDLTSPTSPIEAGGSARTNGNRVLSGPDQP